MNGIKQNSLAQTNVEVSGVKNGGYSVKLIFEDGKTGDIDKNFFIESASDINTKIVFKKGKGKLQLVSMVPTVSAQSSSDVVIFRPDNNAVYSDTPVIMERPSDRPVITETITTQTITQSTGNGNAGIQINVSGTEGQTPNNAAPNGTQGGNGSIGISIADPISGENINLNVGVNINGGTTTNGQTNINQNSSTTTITTTTSSNTSTNATPANTTPKPVTQVAVNTGCKNTLTNSTVFIEDLKLQSFEDDRVDALKLALVNTCLYSVDAEKIMDLFTFDANQLSAAKLLFDRLLDKDKASTLTKHITFDSTKMEFRNYISGKN
jgi:anti-sigma28 factor (negative regulator of flagellin synthesis)